MTLNVVGYVARHIPRHGLTRLPPPNDRTAGKNVSEAADEVIGGKY
jgi:hypothetical protein